MALKMMITTSVLSKSEGDVRRAETERREVDVFDRSRRSCIDRRQRENGMRADFNWWWVMKWEDVKEEEKENVKEEERENVKEEERENVKKRKNRKKM